MHPELTGVGRIGLGCVTFGREIDEDSAFRIMDHAMEIGISLFDTAEVYGGGESEKIIGKWMQSRGVRRDVFLLTKVFTNFTRSHLKEALEGSLDRLQTDSLELYMFHRFDPETPMEEAVAAMDDAVKSGRAHACGCSNFSAVQLRTLLEIARAGGITGPAAIQSNYNLAAPGIAEELLPLCVREKIAAITYSPLGAGFLTGKYPADRAAFPKGSRFDVIPGHADVYFSERNFRVVDQLHAMAARVGVSAVRLAMGWVFQNPAVTTVLVGARTTRHLDNAVEALQMNFPPEWLAEMNAWD
ncbi:MAG: aldo/keto reductase [Bryobacteraceae bacterium]